MVNLKITITDDTNSYNADNETDAAVLGELNFSADHCLDVDALENLCGSIFALFPGDPVKLAISYSINNH
jgi:hypothetical protein|tara:strand:- start:1111 stop:1320 length:210 start_codon:yes stop_codon:yes gene_type:complete